MKKLLLSITAGLTLLATGATANGPAAIVKAVTPAQSGVAAMDYLEPGRTVELGTSGELVIGYLRSCVEERITGGTVTVGTEQSAVLGGRVTRQRVECDGGRLTLTADQAAKAGVLIFRNPQRRAR